MLIDTHAHLDFLQFKETTTADIIKRAQENGVTKIINVAADLNGAKKSVALAHEFANIWATVGIHPHDVLALKKEPQQLTELAKLADKKKVVALGEIGLDYFKNYSPADLQKEFLAKQIEIGLAKGLPLIIHNREADDDILEILKHYQPKKVVFHCYSSSVEYAKKLLDLGYLLSFTGNITFPKNTQGAAVVKYVPLDKLMIETDCPFMTPVPHRGKTNEPALVKHVAEKIAELKNITLEEVAATTSATAEAFFNLVT